MGARPRAPQGGPAQPVRLSSEAFRLAAILILVLPVGLLLGGCGTKAPAPVESRDGSAPVPRGYYRVREGDTLQHIALRNGLEMPQLAEWNGLQPPYRIYTGRLLQVVAEPAAGSPASPAVTSKQPDKRKASGREPASLAGEAATAGIAKTSEPKSKHASVKAGQGGLRWQWPLSGRVVHGFRAGDRTRQGVRIAGRAGQPVAAAEGGTVVYSGSGLKGYGNLIIVKHNNEFLSAYGFNRRLLVKEGQKVRRGQSVAEVGQAAGGEYLLHFEIRRNGIATDPLAYLPKAR